MGELGRDWLRGVGCLHIVRETVDSRAASDRAPAIAADCRPVVHVQVQGAVEAGIGEVAATVAEVFAPEGGWGTRTWCASDANWPMPVPR